MLKRVKKSIYDLLIDMKRPVPGKLDAYSPVPHIIAALWRINYPNLVIRLGNLTGGRGLLVLVNVPELSLPRSWPVACRGNYLRVRRTDSIAVELS